MPSVSKRRWRSLHSLQLQTKQKYVFIAVHFQNDSRVDFWISETEHWRSTQIHNFLFALYKGNKCTNKHKLRREEINWWKHWWRGGLRETMLSLLIRPPQIKPLRRLTRHTIWRRRLQSNSFFFLNFIKQLDARGTKYLGISKVAKKH